MHKWNQLKAPIFRRMLCKCNASIVPNAGSPTSTRTAKTSKEQYVRIENPPILNRYQRDCPLWRFALASGLILCLAPCVLLALHPEFDDHWESQDDLVLQCCNTPRMLGDFRKSRWSPWSCEFERFRSDTLIGTHEVGNSDCSTYLRRASRSSSSLFSAWMSSTRSPSLYPFALVLNCSNPKRSIWSTKVLVLETTCRYVFQSRWMTGSSFAYDHNSDQITFSKMFIVEGWKGVHWLAEKKRIKWKE